MRAQNIPASQWPTFYQRFAHLYKGLMVRVETIREGLAPRLELCDLQLQDVSLEINSDGTSGVHIRAEHPTHARWTDLIFKVIQTRLDSTETGDDLGLTLTAANGTVMRLRFQTAPVRLPVRDVNPRYQTWSYHASQT